METKQVIVVRKDLKMRTGKIGAQAAHASFKVLMAEMLITNSEHYPGYKEMTFTYPIDGAWNNWIEGLYKKICVSVNSEQELIDIFQRAQDQKLPCAMVEDHGLTEFKGVHTKTCCAIGPAEDAIINAITGHLPLL